MTAGARPSVLGASALLTRLPARRFQSTAPERATAPETTTVRETTTAPENLDPNATLHELPTSVQNLDLSASLHELPAHIGYLKELGLDYGYGPTAIVEWVLEHMHVLAGTPWWASIALTAVAFRLLFLKPFIAAANNSARMARVQPITKPLMTKMQEQGRVKDNAGMMATRREIQVINQRAGVSFVKSLVPMTQVFVGYGTFVLLRGMSNLPVPGMEAGGALWFQNLTIPDPYFILPAATSYILHVVMKVCPLAPA